MTTSAHTENKTYRLCKLLSQSVKQHSQCGQNFIINFLIHFLLLFAKNLLMLQANA